MKRRESGTATLWLGCITRAETAIITSTGTITTQSQSKLKMLKEKAGALAGQIWEALNGTEGLTQKQIKKATKLKADKDFFLGLGWLLREDKVVTSEVEGELFVKLN